MMILLRGTQFLPSIATSSSHLIRSRAHWMNHHTLRMMSAAAATTTTPSGVTLNSFPLNKAFIGGKWHETKTTFSVVDPSNGQVIGQAPNCTKGDVESAIECARDAFPLWSKKTAKERGQLLRRLFDIQVGYSKELGLIVSQEMGKPLNEAIGEIVYGASFIEWFSEQARSLNGEIIQSPYPDKLTMWVKEPAGPVGIITPWNFPNAMITRKVAPALAVGCTVIVRPAESCPFSALAIARMAEEAGIPPGVINVVPTDRDAAPMVGELLCTSPDVPVLSFTGSTIVGKQLLSWGAPHVKRVCLELGGNAPFIVFDSADPVKAAEGCIATKFRNCGQTCVSANRIFVQDTIHDEFVKELASCMKKSLRVGSPRDAGTTIGPLVNGKALDKVITHVQDAVAKGGQVLVGGKHIDGNFFSPTLITGVTPDMQLMQEETFGPVAGIIRFKTEEEAVELANSTRMGLAGYFFSRNMDQVWRVARNLKVGMVGINEGIFSCPEGPFGGVKESGLGREGGHMGMDEFVDIKYMCIGGMKF